MAATDSDGTRILRPAVPALSVVACILIVIGSRWALTADRSIFHLAPDEPSQLAVARWLSGGTHWNMFDHATWQPGLAVLVTPMYWLTDDGESVVRGALALNVIIGGLAAALLTVLLRRLVDLSWPVCAAISVVVAVAPASISASSYIWAEPLVSFGFLAVTLLLLRYHDDGDPRFAAIAIAAAVVAYSCHSRLLPLIGSAALATVGWELWRRRWGTSVLLAAWTAGLFALSAAWKSWVLQQVWDDPSNQNTVDAVWKRAQQPLDVAEALLGQLWYQSAATFGLAVLGGIWVARSIPATIDDTTDDTTGDNRDDTADDTDSAPSLPPIDHVAARIIAITTLPLIVLSAIFMAGRERSDQFIYGRYNDAIVWPLVALGLVWVVYRVRDGVSRRDVALTGLIVVATIGSGYAIEQWHGDAIRENFGVRAMIAGLLPYAEGPDSVDVWRATLISCAVLALAMGLIGAAARTRVGRVPLLAIGLAVGIGGIAVAAHRSDEVLDARLNGWGGSAPVVEVDALVPTDVPLAVKTVATADDPSVSFTTQRQRYHVYQFYLSDRTFLRDRGLDDGVGPYVFAPLHDPELEAGGAELIWTDPSTQIGLWLEPTG